MFDVNATALLFFITSVVMACAMLWKPSVPAVRALVCSLCAVSSFIYLHWRSGQVGLLMDAPAFPNLWTWVFTVVEFVCIAESLIFMLLMSRTRDNFPAADAHERRLRALPPADLPEIDIWIATYDEDWSILEKTLIGVLHIDYPKDKIRVCVLDDGRRSWLGERCREIGVEHITRSNSKDKKAGNHNNAMTISRAPFILSLDADFVPFPNIILRLIGFFEDPKVGIVQSPQTYYNKDVIRKSLGLSTAPDELAFFYREIQPSRDAWDSAFYCGSCAILRRAALESVGGFVTETDIEDQAAAVKLLANGYKTRFLSETLSVGLSAESHAVFHDQRNRWCRGSLQLVFTSFGPFGRGLNLVQRLFFLQTSWIVWSVAPLVFYVTPAILWMFDGDIYMGAAADELLLIPFFLFTTFTIAMSWLSRLHWVPVLSAAAQLFIAAELAPTAVTSLLKPFGKPLIKIMPVTPKGASAESQRIDLLTFSILLSIALVTLGSFVYGMLAVGAPSKHPLELVALSFWTIYTLLVVSLACLICSDHSKGFTEPSFEISRPVRIIFSSDYDATGEAVELSLAGARIRSEETGGPAMGSLVWLDIPAIGLIAARLVFQKRDIYSFEFEPLDDDFRRALIKALFTDPDAQSEITDFKAGPMVLDLVRRYFGLLK